MNVDHEAVDIMIRLIEIGRVLDRSVVRVTGLLHYLVDIDHEAIEVDPTLVGQSTESHSHRNRSMTMGDDKWAEHIIV